MTVKKPSSSSELPIHLDLEAIEARNAKRRKLKTLASPGPWRVTTRKYRGMGTKYEVCRLVGSDDGGDMREETVVPPDHDRDNKEFIAFARNDTAESDIDRLVAGIRELEGYARERQRFVETIAALEADVAAQKSQMAAMADEHGRQVAGLTAENQRLSADYQTYVSRTETIYNGLGILQEALAFYADEKNWEWHFVSNAILKDNGDTAREALSRYGLGPEQIVL